MLSGIDVSKHQGKIDWTKVKTAANFVFIKATEGGGSMGKGYLDPSFRNNWSGARDAGLTRGAYHFARVSDKTGSGRLPLLEDARDEAVWFWSSLSMNGWTSGQDLPPVLDIEWGGADEQGLSPAEVRDWCLEFLGELTGLCGREPIVYVGPNFWRYKLLKDPRFQQYPLWVVDINNPKAKPKAMGEWAWLFHQYTFTGTVPGISAKVDLDVFRGTLADLQEFVSGSAPPAPPPPVDYTPPCDLGLPLIDLNSTPYPRGEAVERIQAMLLSHGYGPAGLVTDGVPDGIAGPLTRDAVGRFQRDCGLVVDNKVGPKTWWALLVRGLELS